MTDVIPGLGDDMVEDEKLCILIAGTLDGAIMIGMLKGKTTLNEYGRVVFNRLMLKMKSVPPQERLEKALKSTHGQKIKTNVSTEMLAKTVHKLLAMGLIPAYADYQKFQKRASS